jgi:hypothetical protein
MGRPACVIASETSLPVSAEREEVPQAARRRGVFNSLLWMASEWARKKGLERLTFKTQIQNRPALCAIARMGFCFEQASYPFTSGGSPKPGGCGRS